MGAAINNWIISNSRETQLLLNNTVATRNLFARADC